MRGTLAASWLYAMLAAAVAAEPDRETAATGVGGPPAGRPASRPGRSTIFGGSQEQRREVLAALPLDRLTPEATERVLRIAESPAIYRRLPTQAIECDRSMFLFLSRNPEVLVGIWKMMGITQVQTERVGPYQLAADDGSGTECDIDLIYGDENLHLFVADGCYRGRFVAAPVRGRGVFVLRSSYAQSASGGTTVTGVIDCFIQFDNLGADLVARTFSELIGRSADQNFMETARFVSQISQMSEQNPEPMIDLAMRLPEVIPPTRQRFAETITTVARRGEAKRRTATPEPAVRHSR